MVSSRNDFSTTAKNLSPRNSLSSLINERTDIPLLKVVASVFVAMFRVPARRMSSSESYRSAPVLFSKPQTLALVLSKLLSSLPTLATAGKVTLTKELTELPRITQCLLSRSCRYSDSCTQQFFLNPTHSDLHDKPARYVCAL